MKEFAGNLELARNEQFANVILSGLNRGECAPQANSRRQAVIEARQLHPRLITELLMSNVPRARSKDCRRYRYITFNLVFLISQFHINRGHRPGSFQTADITELVEIRARQRTFDGAYRRTAMGNLGYALAVLRLFDRRFYRSMCYYYTQ